MLLLLPVACRSCPLLYTAVHNVRTLQYPLHFSTLKGFIVGTHGRQEGWRNLWCSVSTRKLFVGETAARSCVFCTPFAHVSTSLVVRSDAC